MNTSRANYSRTLSPMTRPPGPARVKRSVLLRTEASPIPSAKAARERLEEVQAQRSSVFRTLRAQLRGRQSEVGPSVVQDAELARLRAENYQAFDTQNSALLIALADAAVAQVADALGLRATAAIVGKVKSTSVEEYSFGVNGSATAFRSVKNVSEEARFAAYLAKRTAFLTMRKDAADKGELPSGPAYNRLGRQVLDAAKNFVRDGGKFAYRRGAADLAASLDDPQLPYQIPMPQKPGRLRFAWRAARTLLTYHRGAIENRAIHLLLSRLGAENYPDTLKELPLLVDTSQLPPGTPIDWQIKYRRYVDRAALALLAEAQSGELGFEHRRDLLQSLAHGWVDAGPEQGFLPTPAMQREVRKIAGNRLMQNAGIDLRVRFAPYAEELFRRYAEECGGKASMLFVPNHNSTMDQMYFLAGMPGFALDGMFGGTPSLASIVARRDYMKNVPGLNLVDLAQDQGRVFGVTMITEGNSTAMKGLIRSMKQDKRSALLFAVGGRNPTYWHHNPFVPDGFGFLAGAADLIVPVSIINSTGEEMRGGSAELVIGRPAKVADFADERGRLRDTAPLIHYAWQEQKDHLFTWTDA